jgi:DNA-directed RNA polymerase subunit N
VDPAQDGENRNHTGDNVQMIIPVRCFTCGKQIADKWETFSQRVRAGDKPQKVLDELGIRRYCCRRMMITHVEIIDEFLKYPQVTAKRRSELV